MLAKLLAIAITLVPVWGLNTMGLNTGGGMSPAALPVARSYDPRREHQIIFGDALKKLWQMPPASVDLCLTDPPFGTTNCAWDAVIPLPEMWAALRRVMKPQKPVLLFGTQPFTTTLINSNLAEYQTTWYWRKNVPTNFTNAKTQPLRVIEDVCVFNGKDSYFPLGLRRVNWTRKNGSCPGGAGLHGEARLGDGSTKLRTEGGEYVQEFTNYPINYLPFDKDPKGLHPNQKPVALLAYLIESYSMPGDVVLDFTCGSASCGVAAVRTGRRYVGIESDLTHAQTAVNRVGEAVAGARHRPESDQNEA